MNVSPVIKWVGGKTQLINEIFSHFPKNINTYIEPFIGGASVLINLLLKVENKEIECNRFICGDVNYCLINLYITIKNNPRNLINALTELKENFEKSEDKEKFYYDKRIEYNKIKKTKDNNLITELAALFIFLNKTSFRGVYRENSKGEYNVPYGNYKSLTIFDSENILNLSLLFNKYNVEFINDTYDYLLSVEPKDNCFIYLDPPYYPENSTSFTKYSSGDFSQEDHFNLFYTLKSNDFMFLLSNSYTEYVLNEFKDYETIIVSAKRSINSKNPESKTNEVLIKNYFFI